MNNELFLNNSYVDDLCSDDSIEEVLPYLLSLLPLNNIPRTRLSDELVEGLRRDSDTVHAFISNCCELSRELHTSKDSLYENYARYCIENGREAHKKHGFMRALKSLGLKEARNSKTREYCWKGIGLKSDERSLVRNT